LFHRNDSIGHDNLRLLLHNDVRLNHTTTNDCLWPVFTSKVNVASWEPVEEKLYPFGVAALKRKTTHWQSGLPQELASDHIFISHFDE
jgi:hypothetical protein